MSDSTFDAAMSAFESSGIAADTDQLDASGQPVPVPGTNQPEASAPADQEGNQPETPETSESSEEVASREIDLSGLPEEAQIFLRARQREMQADYTRKTQELAERQREAEQSQQFIEALNSDPQFAMQVFTRLQDQLTQAGYFEQQARQPQGQEDFYGDEFTDEPYSGPDPYERELAEMRQWREQMEAQWQQAQLNAHIDRSIAEIRSSHPDYTEADIQDILDLGFATGGDLGKANEIFQGMRDRTLASYLQSKGGVNTPAVLPSGQGTPAPEELKEADDLTLRAVATERLMNALNQ